MPPRAFAPQQLGKYTLLRKIATGGMAEVFLARADGAAGFQKTMVIKRILPNLSEDVQFVEMFLNEARVASQLNHPNVVSIHELGEVDGSYYIAMEYIDGPNLRALARRAAEAGKQLDVNEVVKIIALAADGLAYAHDAVGLDGQPLNLIHRDISPDNILVSRQGAVKVVDFGIAKAANQPHLTKSGMLKGKISYMPPEQIRGHALDRRADVFALGVCLYELLAGNKPFENTSEVAVMQAILHNPPSPIDQARPDVDAALSTILDKALAKDREQRYATCAEMQADLDAYLMRKQVGINARDLAKLVEGLMGPAAPMPTPANFKVPSGVSDPLGSKGGTPAPNFNQDVLTGVDAPVDLTVANAAAVKSPASTGSSRGPIYAVGGLAAVLLLAGVAFVARHSAPQVESEIIKVAPPPKPVAVAPPAPAPKPAPQPAPAAVVEPTRPAPAPTAVAEPVKPEPVKPEPAKPEPEPEPAKPELAKAHEKHHPKLASHTEPAKPAPAPTPAAPVAAATGKITVRVLPFAEDVIVDGKHYGATPLDAEPVVSAGHHTVVLVRGGTQKQIEVNVPAGGAAVVKHVFEN